MAGIAAKESIKRVTGQVLSDHQLLFTELSCYTLSVVLTVSLQVKGTEDRNSEGIMDEAVEPHLVSRTGDNAKWMTTFTSGKCNQILVK